MSLTVDWMHRWLTRDGAHHTMSGHPDTTQTLGTAGPKGLLNVFGSPFGPTYGSGAPAGDHFKVAAAVTRLARAPRPPQHSSTHASL